MNKREQIKRISFVITVVFAAIAIIHIGFYVFLNLNGKSLLKNYIKSQFAAEAELDSISFKFPFTVVVKNFKCNDLSFNKADISLGFFNPFASHITLSKIYVKDLSLKLKIEKDKFSLDPLFTRQLTKEELAQPQPQPVQAISVKNKPKNFSLAIGRLLINNASITVADLTQDPQVNFILHDVNVRLKHFVYPSLTRFFLDIKASLEKKDVKDDNLIMVKGWVDYAHRNMALNFNIDNADYALFSEYYPPFWKPNNLGVKEAKLSLDSKLNSINNDLIIEAILSLDKIEYLQTQDNPNVNSVKTMITFFNGDNGKPSISIKLKTKMDSFHIDFASLQSEFQGKMKFSIGSIVFNILDKAKNKIKDTTKEVKDAAVDKIDKVVDKTKQTVGNIKDITVDKAVDAAKDVAVTIQDVIKAYKKGKMEEKESSTASEQSAPESEKPAALAPSTPVNENTTAPNDVNTQTSSQSQNVTTSVPAATENPTQGTPVNTENQNQAQPVQQSAQ